MLLHKQSLTTAALRHFGLLADPFSNDLLGPEDVFISPGLRYVRESLWQHARHGGLLALVGESGSGKSTAVAAFRERLRREGRDCVLIEPSVLYMEENDRKGKTLKSAALIQAILSTLAPTATARRDAEARARQMHALLCEGHRAGRHHVLVIEEAHCLPTATLKHLKRFAELRDGMAPLLSILLVGQPELKRRLAAHPAELRELAQRCDVIELPPLEEELEAYLGFKFRRIGVQLERIVSADALQALRQRLSVAAGRTVGGSLLYPLAVANALRAAMNLAASLGASRVDGDIVKEM
jgi:type II secretory pathway predicted ATPase ExeA